MIKNLITMRSINKFYLFLLITLFSNLQIKSQVNTKLIGDQIWMTSNLNVTKFQNGDPIFEAKTKAQWIKASEDKKPAWCYYKNNAQYGTNYGKLYNWYAVNDPRGLAPKGWHISSDSEWKEMIAFLQKDIKDVNEALKSKTGWIQYESGGHEVGSDCYYCKGTGQLYSKFSYKYISCAYCYGTGGDRRYIKKRILSGNGTNTSGFSAKPGADRFDDGDFSDGIGLFAMWWLASDSSSDGINAKCIYIDNDFYTPQIENYGKGYGFSIRLIKDNPEKEKKELEEKFKREEKEK
jgi:uncharacterized protein (TIGR02145 family)